MARILAFVPDLLFGSAVVSSLTAAGHQVELTADPGRPADGEQPEGWELLIVDLTAEAEQRIARVLEVRPRGLPVLAFYAHVESDVRRRAEAAGFDLVVPRSRLAREGAALAARLLSGRGQE